MNRLQVREFIIIRIDAHAEKKTGVAPVDDFQAAEFDKVGLMLLVTGSDEAVDLSEGESRSDGSAGESADNTGLEMCTSPLSLIFSSS